MLKVGITGGIGSGKSTVCAVFGTLGIPVLYADEAARLLMEKDEILIAGISSLFGKNVYKDGQLNRKGLAAIIFHDKDKLARLNALVHPATIRYGAEWLSRQTAPYAIKEAALFYESGSSATIDIMIGVSAPEELRIARVIQRSAATREEVLDRIAQQMNEAEKMARCDYVIVNDDTTPVLPQVLEIHQTLLTQAH